MSQFPRLVSADYLNSPMVQAVQEQMKQRGIDKGQQALLNDLTQGDDELFESIRKMIDQSPGSSLDNGSQNPFQFPEFTPLKDVLPRAFESGNNPFTGNRLNPDQEANRERSASNSAEAAPKKQKNAVSAAANAIQKTFSKKFDFDRVKNVAPNVQRQISQIPVPKIPSQLSAEQIDRLQQLQKRMQEISRQQNRAKFPKPNRRESEKSSLSKNVTVPKELLDSLFEAMDKSGTDLLSAYLDPERVQDLSWIGQSTKKFQHRMKSMNRQINRLSSRSKSNVPDIQYNYDSALRDQLNASNRMILVGVAAVVTLVAGIIWYRITRGNSQPIAPMTISVSFPIEQVKERKSFVKACNHLATRHFGDPSRFWNHSRMFDELERRNNQSMDRLVSLYEVARYAPPEEKMSSEQITLARNLLKDIQK